MSKLYGNIADFFFYCVLLVKSNFFSRSQHKKEIKYIMGMDKRLSFFEKLCFDSLNKWLNAHFWLNEFEHNMPKCPPPQKYMHCKIKQQTIS